ncbi:MAG: BMP family ABC transporter substrate-binding protein [Clostridia bacterium]|nr:BMP family ABC transporter substrate-binding protein [Clostridia bacterium]
MPNLYYKDAQRLGQREYRARIFSGQYPYLPVLDEILPPERLLKGIDMGLVNVPAEFIVGTRTRGRTNSFAANFMPLLAEGSEFARKWERLCQSHLTEGIRDPVKVYEYLNRYYVEEGNKRVSVLKFFDAVSIPAQVVRIMPDVSAGEAELYLEYVAFNRVTGINYLEFTKKGSFAKLLSLLGKPADEIWTDDDRHRFQRAYLSFRTAYESLGGSRLHETVGDAMLAFIEIYGFDALLDLSSSELRKAVGKAWEEVRLQQEPEPVEIRPDPAEEKKESLIARVLPQRKLRAAFVYDRNPSSSFWAWGHEQGRKHVERVFEGRLETAAYVNATDGDVRRVMEEAIADGSRVVFTTSPRMLPDSLKVAVDHPETMILNCALNQSHRYIRTYYPRIYEAKYVVGAVAGAMAEEGDIGYICDYPIYGMIVGINAFALGVRLTNPRARVVLEWSSVEGHRAARRKLADQGISLISCQDFSRQADGSFGLNGLMRFEGDSPVMLAAPVWKWDVYYEEILRRILSGALQDEYSGSARAINYYWGMSAGVVDVQCAPELPEGVRHLAGLLMESIRREICEPFALPVRTQAGTAVEAEGKSLSLEQIVGMDYLVGNVTGAIPAQYELKRGVPTVKIMGVDPDKGAEPLGK